MKRLCDVVFASLLFLITLPVLLAVMLITWIELRCNVIFAEQRVGKDGKLFVMLKVTSMKPTPENIAARKLGPIRKNDPRITRFSAFIRRYSLDELPQFINVIKGEMSLIGPRPELIRQTEKWREILPDYDRRVEIRPGMSGWAQINGYRKCYIEPEKKLEHDLFYIDNWSLWLDIKIALLTPWAILHYEVW
jgi:lipopolysaccharide/colanic/teichoic acid biosynthesis glycosyltransferase